MLIRRMRWAGAGILLLAALTYLVGYSVETGLLLGNLSPSVARGLYVHAAPHHATHVSFCLDRRHRTLAARTPFCHPDTPGGTRILKRIAERLPNGDLIVRGITETALDSRLLGAVQPAQVKGWWRPLRIRDEPDRTPGPPPAPSISE